MPNGLSTFTLDLELQNARLFKFLESSSDLISRSEGLQKVAQRIGISPGLLGDLQLGSGQSGIDRLLEKIRDGKIPELDHKPFFDQLACLCTNIEEVSGTEKQVIENIANKFSRAQALGQTDPQEMNLVRQSVEEILKSGVLTSKEIDRLAEISTPVGLLDTRVFTGSENLPNDFVALVKTRVFSKLINSATNKFEVNSELANKANLLRLRNFGKLDRNIQNAYLEHVTNNYNVAPLTQFNSLKAAIKKVIGEPPGGGHLVDRVLTQEFQATWNGDAISALDAVKAKLMTLTDPVNAPRNPQPDHLHAQIQQLVSNYELTLGRCATQAQILKACQNNILTFVMSTVPPPAGQPDTRPLHARDFVNAVFTEILGTDNVSNIASVDFNGCLVRHPTLGAEQFGYKPSLAPSTGSTGEVKNTPGRRIELEPLGASKLNFKDALAQQRIFQPSVNMAAEKFYDLALAETLKDRQIDPEKLLRNIARGMKRETYRDERNRFVPPEALRAQGAVVGPNTSKNTYQSSLTTYVKELCDYALGKVDSKNDRSEKLMRGLNDLFLSKFAQAGFHARKYDRMVKDQIDETEKEIRFKAPGAENRPLSDYARHTSRFRSFFLSSRTYGISRQRPDKISDNAARLKFSTMTGEYLMSELIKTPEGTMPASTQALRQQLAKNLGLDDLGKPQTWGDLAEKAKLVFVACTDRTLRANANRNNGENSSHGSLLLNKAIQYAARSTNYTSHKVDPAEVDYFLNIAQNAIVFNTGWVENANVDAPNPHPQAQVPAQGIFNRPINV